MQEIVDQVLEVRRSQPAQDSPAQQLTHPPAAHLWLILEVEADGVQGLWVLGRVKVGSRGDTRHLSHHPGRL